MWWRSKVFDLACSLHGSSALLALIIDVPNKHIISCGTCLTANLAAGNEQGVSMVLLQLLSHD